MAHIRMAHNDLEDKLREAKWNYNEQIQRVIRQDMKAEKRSSFILRIFGLGLTLALVWFLCKPEIPKSVQEWVRSFLDDASLTLIGIGFFPVFLDDLPFLLRLLIGFPLVIVTAALGFLLKFLAPFLGFVVRICMYLITALGPLLIYWSSGKYTLNKERLDDMIIMDTDAYTAKLELGILQAGADGESAALEYLTDLDDDCYVFTNLHIPYDGKESETDLIAVTPSGITIIEVKNYKGVIRGHASDHDLVHTRNERYEEEYGEETFYNPIKQVATHAYRLAGYLRSKDLRTYVRTCVFFVNPEATLQLQGTDPHKCPVFHVDQAEQMLQYLHSGHTSLSDSDIDYAVELLEELM